MNRLIARGQRDERGASLILAIAFLVVIGGISAAVISSVTSGLHDRTVLDGARNREYAADSAIEQSIVRVRGLATPGVTDCATGDVWPALDSYTIRVDCINVPAVAVGAGGDLFSQNDVIFTACVNTGVTCSDAHNNVIIRAQVNFQGASPSPVKTYVQAWSVDS